MVVGDRGPGHVGAHDEPMAMGVVTALDPHDLAQSQIGELGHVARGPDVRIRRTAELVDDDPVVDRDPRRLGQLDDRFAPLIHDHQLGVEFVAEIRLGVEHSGRLLDTHQHVATHGLDSHLAQVVEQRQAEFARQHAVQRILLRQHERDLLAARAECGRHLDAGEAAADERQVLQPVEARFEVEVILEVAEVTHALRLAAFGAQASRPAAGGDQQVVVFDDVPEFVEEMVLLGIELDDLVAKLDVDVLLGIPLVGMQG